MVGDRVYGLSTMWVHPYQARVSTMEEVVKQLTLLISTEPGWPYALVQLNTDIHHAPLPKEGHLSMLVERSTSNVTCRRISQLEVNQFLSFGSQAIYPAGLNGCEVPVIMSLPKSLAKGATLLGGKPINLPVDIPQHAAKGQESKAPSPGGQSISHPDCKPHQGSSAQGRRAGQHDHGSEGTPIPSGIRHLWSCIREFHPKEARAHGLNHISTPQTRRFPQIGGYILPSGHPR